MKLSAKRILALVMALCLCLGLCSFSAKADVDKSQLPVSVTDDADKSTITLSRSLTKATSGSDYDLKYSASTVMSKDLATAAAFCKDDPRMANLLFTCTLEDNLTKRLSDGVVSKNDYQFHSVKLGDNDIFVLVDENPVFVEDGKLKLRYKLNPVVLSAWKTEEAETVKNALRNMNDPMTMTMNTPFPVPAADVNATGTTFKTTAQIDITTTDPAIPHYHESSILAAYGEYDNTPTYIGGGGGGTKTEPTIEIKDNTTIDNAGGTIEVDKPNAKPGETVKIKTHSNEGSMIDHIKVTGADSNRVTLSYEGEGKFTFVVPEGGNVVIETVFRTIPADPDETGVSELLDTDNHRLYLIGDEKGEFRPDASITRAEIATAFFRLLRNQDVERTEHFADVEESKWYVQPIEVLASLGIIEGVGDGVFEPDRAITRAEFAAVAARFAKKLFSGTAFNDVSEEAWYADFVSTAAHYGWINGVGDGAYEPDRDITRTEAAAIINRMLLRISDWIDVDAGHGRHFPDVSEDFWGKYEISEATNNHDHTLEDEYFFEDWHDEDWRETVDNDPVNFGQPN